MMRATIQRCGTLLALVLMSACHKENGLEPAPGIPDQTNGRVTIINDDARLAARMIITDLDVPIDPGQLGKVSSVKAFSLKQIAEVPSPVVNGRTLQATSVVLDNKIAYVSYNMAGPECIGAIDVIQLKSYSNPSLRSEATFTDADVSSVCFDGTCVFLATATANPSFDYPSVIEAISIQGNKLDLTKDIRRMLSSYVATSVYVNSNNTGMVYVTTGNTGGLYTVSRDTLGARSFTSLSDARWVDADGTTLIVAQGTPGRISVFDQASGSLRGTFPFKGAGIPESKSTVRLIGGKALIAAGDGGVQLMNLADGSIIGSLPRLIVAGLDSSRSVTNAVDGAGQHIFISNGEAGVYAAQASTALENQTGDLPIILTTLGQLRFQNLQSVNHVAFDGQMLVIAAGLGGVKIVSVTY
jgi:hypothetical protein